MINRGKNTVKLKVVNSYHSLSWIALQKNSPSIIAFVGASLRGRPLAFARGIFAFERRAAHGGTPLQSPSLFLYVRGFDREIRLIDSKVRIRYLREISPESSDRRLRDSRVTQEDIDVLST
jgi:hypothetical protein